MINPDNFVFHSDFWYPVGYIGGTKSYSNIDIPAQLEMSDKYTPGDYYSVFLDYESEGQIAERFISDTIINYTDGNKLMVFKGARSVGAKFTAKLHWRIYPKNKTFNFLSEGRLEETAKSLTGFLTAPGMVNFWEYEIPTGLTGKHFVRGMYRVEGGVWNLVGGVNNSGFDMQVIYDYNNNKVVCMAGSYPAVQPAGTRIEYKLQIVPIDQNGPYIFNSDKYSFAIPETHTKSITDSATLGENATRTVYGDWIDIPGEKIAYDLVVSHSAAPNTTQQHYAEFQFVANAVTAVATLEGDGSRVRPKLVITNYATGSRSYSNQTITFNVFMYQTNNA